MKTKTRKPSKKAIAEATAAFAEANYDALITGVHEQLEEYDWTPSHGYWHANVWLAVQLTHAIYKDGLDPATIDVVEAAEVILDQCREEAGNAYVDEEDMPCNKPGFAGVAPFPIPADSPTQGGWCWAIGELIDHLTALDDREGFVRTANGHVIFASPTVGGIVLTDLDSDGNEPDYSDEN